ncbi:MAG: xanthine dehydrogenase family protein subunit M [Deltaproteobacteria bacterium]|nr:xanthine dehydrogenase family protein subunit M [Deltaproteobacteria bacterium]
MLLPKFSFQQPASLDEALEILAHHGEQAAVIAGGTDLLVNLKHKNVSPRHLVGLEMLGELQTIGAEGGFLLLGPRLTASTLAGSDRLRGSARALALGASVLGSPQVRNRATVGGNVCNARPAADMSVPLLALEASVLLRSRSGQREVPLAEFFLGPGSTARRSEELLVGIKVPAAAEGSGGGYQKLGLRKALEIALVNVAAVLTLEGDGKTIKTAQVALGSVAPTPILSPGASQALAGQAAGPQAFAEAGRAAAADARPIDDHRGSAEYRRQMVEVLTGRALAQAWQAARGVQEVMS